MPVLTTYPGVYIEEISSGTHAITGVSTSVTAFIGAAKRGPINKALRVQSFADFERRFGGLDAKSDMSYAVRQFFLNGGSEAWVVRVAKAPLTAFAELANSDRDDVLTLSALDQGSAANDIAIDVDYDTDNPGSSFNLSLALVPKESAGDPVFETYRNLSMNSKNGRFAPTIINDSSELVTAERMAPLPGGLAAAQGESRSGDLISVADLTKLIDSTHNTINVELDGKTTAKITLDPPAANTNASLRTAVQSKLQAAFGAANIDVAISTTGGTRKIVITSQLTGEESSVRVLPGETHDAASRLLLGPLFGGVESDAAALLRPAEMPDHARVTGGAIAAAADLDNIPSAHKSLTVVLDGYQSDITLDGPDLAGTLAARLTDLAGRIEAKVRESKPTNPAFKSFTAESDGTHLILESGTRGAGSTIEVRLAGSDSLATDLRLTAAAGADVSEAQAADVTLAGGNEGDLDLTQAYNNFIGDRSKREGIYALEAVDIFNLMVLAHVNDTGILMDAAAYCQERRAFLIVDSPAAADKPEEMEKAITGADLPKTDYAAVYYPWIKIADPLAGGRLKTVAPSGTMAGVYARTDSTRGVWKAPAGTEATLIGVQGVVYPLTDRENGILNPRGANCIRLFPVFGPVSWGARTLKGDDQMTSEWKYVPVRRLALFLEESLYRGTKWVVFEPNDEPLWAQIRLNLGAFMQGLFRQGAFQGQTPKEAYFVKCDKETTTQNDIDLGVVNIIVGFAPLKPAEFVVIKFQQMAGQIRT
jgi:phage tail sheath protein FI